MNELNEEKPLNTTEWFLYFYGYLLLAGALSHTVVALTEVIILQEQNVLFPGTVRKNKETLAQELVSKLTKEQLVYFRRFMFNHRSESK